MLTASMDEKKCSVMKRLFPEIDGVWKCVDLNAIHVSSGGQEPIVADLKAQETVLQLAQAGSASVYTYGGFGEDRDALWFGLRAPAIHLGVDFNNLTPGLSVHSLTSGKVVHVLRDTDKVNGWGGRVIVQHDDRYVLYGHLDCTSLPAVDTIVKEGSIIGKLGASSVNGGWFCHLHLQYMNDKYVKRFEHNMNAIDGYDIEMPEGIINPMSL